MKHTVLFLIFNITLIFWCQKVCSQRIVDHLPSTVFHKNYHQIAYDNDLFRGLDYYYTQGWIYKVANEKLGNFFLYKSLFGGFNSQRVKNQIFVIGAESSAYTPTSITKQNLLDTDRPYSATLTLNFSKITLDTIRNFKLSSELILGVIGPLALGKQMQTSIHKLTNNDEPQGWKYQLENSALVNYNLAISQRIINVFNVLRANVLGRMQVGTMSDRISLGAEVETGNFLSKFSKNLQSKQLYFYYNSVAHFTLYDATLQGGIFTKNIYTIDFQHINHLKYEQHLGIQLMLKRFAVGFDFGNITEEFKISKSHSWGGINLTFYR